MCKRSIQTILNNLRQKNQVWIGLYISNDNVSSVESEIQSEEKVRISDMKRYKQATKT